MSNSKWNRKNLYDSRGKYIGYQVTKGDVDDRPLSLKLMIGAMKFVFIGGAIILVPCMIALHFLT